MILFFSGTGNSKFVAQRIADALGDEILNLNDRIKIRRHFARRNRRASYYRHTDLRLAHSAHRARLASENGTARRKAGVVRHDLRQRDWQRRQVQSRTLRGKGDFLHGHGADRYAGELHCNVQRSAGGRSTANRCQSRAGHRPRHRDNSEQSAVRADAQQPLRPLHERRRSIRFSIACFVKANAFTASSACIGCGQCAKRCPMNNVTLKDGKPVWGKSAAPTAWRASATVQSSAIEYGKKSVGQPRYRFEAL